MLQCGSNDEVIKGNLCSMNCEMEIAQPAKISMLLYMMKIVIKNLREEVSEDVANVILARS